MISRVQLTKEERSIIDRVKLQGWRSKLDNWTIARLALARSLQLPDAPSKEVYPVISAQPGGVELHAMQMTGEGRGEESDFSDLYCALLSVYEGTNLFLDDDVFSEALQRHVRRGLAVIDAEWDSRSDLNRYLLDEIFAERSGGGAEQPTDSALGERLARVLGQIGVGGTLVDTFEGPRLTRFTFRLSQLDDLDRLRRGVDKIGFALGLGEQLVTFVLGAAEQTVVLDIPRLSTAWRSVDWPALLPSLTSAEAARMALPVVLGTDVVGSPLLIDLAETPHLLVGGTTGSGKSVCLHAILLSLLHDSTRAPELLIVDPKAVEFPAYAGHPSLIGGAAITEADPARTALEGLVAEMNRRQKLFAEQGAKDIREAQAGGSDIKRIVAIVDELGDLLMTDEAIELPLVRLAQKARSVGIHLVLATQRPEAATFTGALRSNIPSRIALTVQKAVESRIILDDSGAEKLLGKGDMLVKLTGTAVVRAHGARVTPADISNAVKNR